MQSHRTNLVPIGTVPPPRKIPYYLRRAPEYPTHEAAQNLRVLPLIKLKPSLWLILTECTRIPCTSRHLRFESSM
jgi:hypothetical protein